VSVTITKRLPGFALDVSWQAEQSVLGLFGPSGAGKTLTLQCLAGLVRPDAGRIVVGERVFFDAAAGVDRLVLRPRPEMDAAALERFAGETGRALGLPAA